MRGYNKLKKLYWLQLISVFLLGGYLLFFGQWRIESNLLTILPNSAQQQNFSDAEQALFKNKSQQLMVLITGENALSAHQTLAVKLNEVANVDSVPLSQPSITEISEFYHPFRHNFLAPSYLQHIDNSQALMQLATKQVIQVANPFVSETIATAPRLNLAEYLQVALSNLADVEFDQGVAFVNVQGKRYFLSRLQVTLDGLDLNTSVDISVKLQQLFNDISTTEQVELLYSGVLFHTAESTSKAKAEISTFGVLSIIAVLLLIWSAFRSMLPLLSAVLVISIASVYGFIAILMFFQSLHILTLVFAVTLIGVVIDYCFHALVYADWKQNNQQAHKDNPLIKPLLLGFITTAIGYFILVFSPLSLLSQVAVFMIFGLFGALITVLFLLPQLKGFSKITCSSFALNSSQRGIRLFSKIVNHKKFVFSLLVLALALLAVFAPIKFDDNVRLLNSSPKWLIDQEISVAKALGYQNSQRLIIKAETAQQLLEIQEQVIDRVLVNQANIKVKGIDKLLPSIKRQQHHYALLKKADAQGKFQAVLALSGLSDPIKAFKPLTFQDFLHGPLAEIAQSYTTYYDTGNGLEYASWLEFSQVPLSADNLTWLAKNPHVSLYDTAGDVSYVLGQYRQGILWLLVSAFIVVVVILFAKYGLKAGVLSVIATIGSALLALMLSQLFSNHLNIFNLLAVLLIIALAIDYVIFYQEHGLQIQTFLAISLSALSSTAVFGILVFSATPAVSSFGLTVMIGILCIFILAPISAKNINLSDLRNS